MSLASEPSAEFRLLPIAPQQRVPQVRRRASGSMETQPGEAEFLIPLERSELNDAAFQADDRGVGAVLGAQFG
jgi:hypothetical protein